MGARRAWVALAFGLLVVWLGAFACKSGSQEAAPSASAKLSSNGPDWLPKAALAECQAALAVAGKEPATTQGALRLMNGCTSLIANAACRAAVREVLTAQPPRSMHQAIERCATEYCRVLDDAQSLAACREPLPHSQRELLEPHLELRRAMLLHDFATYGVEDAAIAWAHVADYAESVEKPALRGPPPAGHAAQNPKRRLFLKSDGSGLFKMEGAADVPIKSVAEYSKLIPRAAEDDTGIEITTSAGTSFSQVIGAMDALHNLGYENIQFGTQR